MEGMSPNAKTRIDEMLEYYVSKGCKVLPFKDIADEQVLSRNRGVIARIFLC